MANLSEMLQDLVKGAQAAGANVEIHQGSGTETKLATNYGGIGGAVGGPIGAAIGADSGQKLPAFFASGAGMAGGGLLAAALGGNPHLVHLLARGGAGIGGHLGGVDNRGVLEKLQDQMSNNKSAAFGGGAGGMFGPWGAGIGAGIQDGSAGSALAAGAGSFLGTGAGAIGGGALGALGGLTIGKLIDADPELSAHVGGMLGLTAGALGGSMWGGSAGQNAARPPKPPSGAPPIREKESAVQGAYRNGVQAAMAKLGFARPLLAARNIGN